jgi:hypothetical protein
VRRIVRSYLHPPRGARVICADEKPQLQILEFLHPARPRRPGQPMRVEQNLSSAWRAGDPGGTGCADGTRHGARPSAPSAPRVLGAVASFAVDGLGGGSSSSRTSSPFTRTLPSPHGSTRRLGVCAWPSCRSMRCGSTRSNSGSASSNANVSSGPAPRPTLRWLVASFALRVSGITLPGPFAGLSKAILSSDKRVPNLWDSALAMAGVDPRTIQELAGWADLKMVEGYAHLSPSHKGEAVERIVQGGCQAAARPELAGVR